MIVKPSGTSNTAFFAIPEDADDLFTLRRIIERGDRVISDSTRLVKQVKEYGRPDKGERVKVRIALKVEQSRLDSAVDRLRISGIITDTDNEMVPKGTHHSLSIHAGDTATIDKGRRWRDIELRMLKRSVSSANFILVAIDTQEAAIAKVSGTHVKVIPNIYSGQSGKRYQTKNPNIETYFVDIAKTLSSIMGENDRIIIFGPGESRRRFFNIVVNKQYVLKDRVQIVEGIDVAGEDGIFVFLRSEAMKQIMSTSKLAEVSSMLDTVMLMVNRGEAKFALGVNEVSTAAAFKAIEAVVFSDSIFKTSDEEEIVKLLNLIESHGAKMFAVDSSTDIGLRVSSLGGIVALLRYAIR
ncbi:MAG TPA: mRNA surveillance protein pelota [Nitrososphaera sp.]|jgi:protein pelota|nr:mRNA surveillance protein pelota [Nitrososphaera sp.]